jgi:hypothetical protein
MAVPETGPVIVLLCMVNGFALARPFCWMINIGLQSGRTTRCAIKGGGPGRGYWSV